MERIYSQHWDDYELIDAGHQKKLERWGSIITIRPDRNAYFKPVLSKEEWLKKAHVEFVEQTKNSGTWKVIQENSIQTSTNEFKPWTIHYATCTFNLKLTRFKHVGLFPEQQSNWDFISSHLQKGDSFLNLFAYTGAASILANSTGANVYHCDSVKQIISWARQNMESSNQENIHWVLEDALKFAHKEVKRNKKYKGIIMDPPAFGIGVKKERWKLENKFPELVELASQLLEKDGFLIINTYSPKLKESVIKETIQQYFQNKSITIKKLAIKTTTGKILEYGELTRVY